MSFNFRALALSAVSACAVLAGTALEARTLNIAMTPPEESHYGAAAKAFKEKIEELSGGDITVEIKANGVLGGEREILEGMQIGSIEMGVTSTGPVGGFVPSTYVLDLPFLFKDYANARAILDGPIGQDLLDDFEPIGIMALGWAENGFRYVTNSKKPIETPEDMKDMKIRTMENDIHLGSFTALGAAPLPMSWNEVITALQQGTIDGQETPMSIFIANRIWEVQKYATLTGHFYSPSLIMMSKVHWDQLSEEEQGWVREAAAAGVAANRAYVENDEKRGLEMLRANGMEVIETVDQEAFAEAVSAVYDVFTSTYGSETLEKIRAAQQ
ncbi:TRAP transporter substrate-binding protein [Rhodobacter sp. 24-YEA-8]|uniref:TRAP transporter substrate-binding protein n=1 Tax=Rhodobacter sp. 24-YEA-8 TaxID=1884310 RepID=UPI0008946EE2|nr:TRAP transporter substrate-binding protein [Rhodobacter sp. 24-YEA-8]SED65761.1 tripartite ATP-independent transporter solute receptor, DctP family [Rhodobacter sp. 24-YEA-8]